MAKKGDSYREYKKSRENRVHNEAKYLRKHEKKGVPTSADIRGHKLVSSVFLGYLFVIIFLVSNLLLSIRSVSHTVNVGGEIYTYKTVGSDDVDNLGNSVVDVSFGLVKSFIGISSALGSLFRFENGKIVILEQISKAIVVAVNGLDKVVNFITGKVFDPIVDWLAKIFGKGGAT